jgi:hypothetical protein
LWWTCLQLLLSVPKWMGKLKGCCPLVDEGLLILQYDDTTILLMEHDLAKARNL